MLEELLKYQELDSALYEIEQKIAKSEERTKTVQAKKFIDQVKDKLDSIEEKAKKLADTYDVYMRSYKSLTSEKEDFEKAIKDAEDGGEVAYLRKKASDLLNKMSDVENHASALKKMISDLLEGYDKLKRQTANAKKQYEEYMPKYKSLKEQYKKETEEISAKLKKMESGIDPTLLERYKTRRKSGFPVLVPVREDGVTACPKCGMSFSMADKSKINQRGFIECESCHVLIYNK